MYDVIVVGGGPAGLSAALVLARSRRKVLVFDAGTQRNLPARAMHGYLTRDGISPAEYLSIARSEVRGYGVEIREEIVTNIRREEDYFFIESADKKKLLARKILLAPGVQDRLPDIPGFGEFYGTSIHHCPYCDGWEHQDERIAVIGIPKGGVALSGKLKQWSERIFFLPDRAHLSKAYRDQFAAQNVEIVPGRISGLEGREGRLERVLFENGDSFECSALFFVYGYNPQSNFAAELGCAVTRNGAAFTNRKQLTNVPGVYVAGDACREMTLVVVAAAEGAKAAVAINTELMEEARR